MNKIRIVYAGLDNNTFFLISKEPKFTLTGAGYNEDLLQRSFNPINHIGRFLYLLRSADKLRVLENVLRTLWTATSFFSTGILRKNQNYLRVLSAKKIKIVDIDSQIGVKYLHANADLLLINAWGMLGSEVISACKYGTFNVHPSLLPLYRGSVPTLWALKNNDAQTGVSYMIIDDSMDGGLIINQHIFDLERNDNWYSIELKVAEIIKNTLVDDVCRYIQGELIPYAQDEQLHSKTASYNSYRRIDWETENGIDIYNKINFYLSKIHQVLNNLLFN